MNIYILVNWCGDDINRIQKSWELNKDLGDSLNAVNVHSFLTDRKDKDIK